jgi:hypothetical protein
VRRRSAWPRGSFSSLQDGVKTGGAGLGLNTGAGAVIGGAVGVGDDAVGLAGCFWAVGQEEGDKGCAQLREAGAEGGECRGQEGGGQVGEDAPGDGEGDRRRDAGEGEGCVLDQVISGRRAGSGSS